MSEEIFDYIVVGAGSAGCVLANRLSADPKNKVLLLEAGGKDKNPWIHIPVGYIKTMVDPTINWLFDTEPDPDLADRTIPVPRGKVLGGSSSINGMIYVRGQARDFDVWSQLGNRGWSHADVLPFFKRAENREGATPSDTERSTGGPLNVADVTETYDVLDRVIQAAEQAGHPRNPDYNVGDQDGFNYFQLTQKGGKRWSTKRAYLDPAKDRPNLRIETHAFAQALTFEGTRCTGVTYEQKGRMITAKAGREVILAAGAIQSPQLMELSGIGREDVLKPKGIEMRLGLDGVGENLQDHYIARLVWRLKPACVSLNQLARGVNLVGEAAKLAFLGKGALTMPAGIIGGFVKTRDGLETPDMQFHIAHASFADPKKRVLDPFPGLTFGPCQLRPESRGSVHIKGRRASDAPAIRPNFLSAETDRQTLVAGMRMARDIAAQPALAEIVDAEHLPGSSPGDDDALLDHARRTGATLYHPVGTCAMGPDARTGAVVDDRLRVHGMSGLRIADGSIMPRLTSGNTNAPIIMIGEKASDMVLEDNA